MKKSMAYHAYCDQCGDPYPLAELVAVEGGFLCGDCLHDHLNSDKAFEENGVGFMEQHEADFMFWLFSGDAYLEPWRRMKFMKDCWEEYRRLFPEDAKEAERDFMRSLPGEFENFVKEAS